MVHEAKRGPCTHIHTLTLHRVFCGASLLPALSAAWAPSACACQSNLHHHVRPVTPPAPLPPASPSNSNPLSRWTWRRVGQSFRRWKMRSRGRGDRRMRIEAKMATTATTTRRMPLGAGEGGGAVARSAPRRSVRLLPGEPVECVDGGVGVGEAGAARVKPLLLPLVMLLLLMMRMMMMMSCLFLSSSEGRRRPSQPSLPPSPTATPSAPPPPR